MADYVVLYSNSTGYILGSWLRATSDNISSFSADGHLTIDGDRVINSIGTRTDLAAVLLTDPTDIDVLAPLNTHKVDDLTTPADADERVDTGRDPDYNFDNPIP